MFSLPGACGCDGDAAVRNSKRNSMANARKSSKTTSSIRNSRDKPVKVRKKRAPTDFPRKKARSLATSDHGVKSTTAAAPASAGQSAEFRTPSKLTTIISMLQRDNGTTISALCEATGWQAHSVRGVLSGAVKKKLGFEVASTKTSGVRTYRIVG